MKNWMFSSSNGKHKEGLESTTMFFLDKKKDLFCFPSVNSTNFAKVWKFLQNFSCHEIEGKKKGKKGWSVEPHKHSCGLTKERRWDAKRTIIERGAK
jgi:hypothetical protein